MASPQLRTATTMDAAAIAAIYAPYVQNTNISFEAVPPNVEEMARRIEELLPHYPWIVAERKGKMLGYAYAHAYGERAAYSWSAVSSVYIAEDARGQGLGSILYNALEGLLAAQGVHSLYAHVTHPNPASEAFHLALGYQQQGYFPAIGHKFGQWVGVTHYCKVLLPCEGVPAELTPFARLKEETIHGILLAAGQER